MNKYQFISFKIASYDESLAYGKNQENRKYNHSHISELKEQWIESPDILPPITVNVITNNVIDGQHRLKAYKELIEDNVIDKDTKIKVMFVSVPIENEKEAIVNANIHSKNWSLDDYIYSYIKAGLEPYCKLQEWCKTHALCYRYVKDKETKEQTKEFKYRYAASMLTGKRCPEELKSATFSFTDEQMEIANEVHIELMEIIEALDKKGYGAWIEPLAVTWHQYRGMHPFKVWLREIKLKKNKLQRMPSDNAGEWEAIFNTVHGAIDKKSECTVAA